MSYDFTIGESRKILQLTLVDIDQSVNPPVTTPLDLTDAEVTLQFAIGDIYEYEVIERQMVVADATNGIVQYTFVSGDLEKPEDFNRSGKFQFAVKVVYPNGRILYSNDIGNLTIKDKVGT